MKKGEYVVDQDKQSIFDEYKFSRHMIQMRDARIIGCDFENKNPFSGESSFNIKFSLKRNVKLISPDLCHGFLYAHIDIASKKDDKLVMPIDIKCMGNFILSEGESLGEDEFVRQVALQLVPQLLPYVRELLSTISTMSLAVPIILPTMDVIQSIRLNKGRHNDGKN